tara:strand:- start:1246 stop:1485 length:240 start_codon:yes stop_codon:yes gene_type:complete
MNYIKFLDYLSTAVFSYIGTTVGLKHKHGNIISIIFGLLTAMGGGTIRHLISGEKILFWIENPYYLIISLLFGIIAILY